MTRTPSPARSPTPARAGAITDAVRLAAKQDDYLTSDHFKVGLAEVRTATAEVRTEIGALSLDTRLSTQITDERTDFMSVSTICPRRDPLFAYILDTYDAHPLRLPDRRIKPMTLFTVVNKRHRYMGCIRDVVKFRDWHAPQVFEADFADFNTTSSQGVSLRIAFGLLAPFLSMMFDTNVAVDLKGIAKRRVEISLGDTRRKYVNPAGLYAALDGKRLREPLETTPRWRLYVVDSVLKARQVTIRTTGSHGATLGTPLLDQLQRLISVDAVLGDSSTITITGAQVPFAFTCLALDVANDSAKLSALVPSSRRDFAFAAGGTSGNAMTHAIVGDANEFIEFDPAPAPNDRVR